MLTRLLLVCGASVILGAFQNDLDQPLNFHCDHEYQSIHRVYSQHNNHAEDRRFELTCANINGDDFTNVLTSCYWSDYVNTYDNPVHFSCPTTHYISGMASVHNNNAEDRIWKYYCCEAKGYHVNDCSRTGYTNEFDQVQDYTVQDDEVMKGASSVHNNYYEDRRFEFEVCKIVKIDDEIIG